MRARLTQINQDDLAQIKALGFSVEGIQDIGDYYLVERDVMLKKDRLKDYKTTLTFPLTIPNGRVDQARGNDLISYAKQRDVRVFVDSSIPTSGDDNWGNEVQQAINDINGANSRIRMIYVTSLPADITVRSDAGSLIDLHPDGWWVLAAAEPPSSGNPGFQIRINLDTNNNMVFSSGQKRYNMAHELGHCVGFRHTNWSGLGEISATGVTGTPNSGSNPDPSSVMNGGTALNSWVGFSAYDVIAYTSTYPRMTASISGPNRGNNSGLYTWTSNVGNGTGPYSYVWEYSTNGSTFNGTIGTGSTLTANLPYNFDLYLRLTVTRTGTDEAATSSTFLVRNLDI